MVLRPLIRTPAGVPASGVRVEISDQGSHVALYANVVTQLFTQKQPAFDSNSCGKAKGYHLHSTRDVFNRYESSFIYKLTPQMIPTRVILKLNHNHNSTTLAQ